MDVAGLISSFSTAATYTVTRRQVGQVVRGIAQATTDTTFTIVASIQPASGKDMLRLPEGRRANETRTVFTATPLFTGDQGSGYEADLVTVDGDQWEVQQVADWLNWGSGSPYYRCLIQPPTPETNP